MADEERDHITIRLSPETHRRLREAAAERLMSRNYLIERACEDFLDRLIPIDEVQLTRPPREDP